MVRVSSARFHGNEREILLKKLKKKNAPPRKTVADTHDSRCIKSVDRSWAAKWC